MDEVIRYLGERFTHFFYSCTPSSALILWWPTGSESEHRTFVTRRADIQPHQYEELIRDNYRSPLVLYRYEERDRTLHLEIEGESMGGEWHDQGLRERVAKKLGIPYRPGGTGKPPNDPLQVTDIFHIWSRTAFAGIQKTDIDGVVFDPSSSKAVLVEVKRSSQRKVGEWLPFYQDPYVGLASFARAKGMPLLAVHHETPRRLPVFDSTEVDVFLYSPDMDFDFTVFSREANRKVMKLKNLIRFIHELLL